MPWKHPIPQSMTQIGHSPRATENLKVTYARLNKENLRNTLLRDGALLNERVKLFNISVYVADPVMNVLVHSGGKKPILKKNERKKKISKKKGKLAQALSPNVSQ